MNEEQRKALRARFGKKEIGKRPVITCPGCDSQTKCTVHEWLPCDTCGVTISTAHTHVDYIGQAHVRARLSKVDPDWSWEPMGITDEGLPAVDARGGLWIRLTVCGVTRIGYGVVERGRHPNATEAINRAIRFTARDEFGVGLYLLEQQPRREQPAEPVGPHADAAEGAPAVEPVDVPLPFDEGERRDALRREIQEQAATFHMDIPTVAADFFQWSNGSDLLDPRLDPDRMAEFLAYLRHPGGETP